LGYEAVPFRNPAPVAHGRGPAGAERALFAAVEPARRPGRPRNAQADAVIVEAARELISRLGTANLSMDAVAEHAGVSKATIYRRWPSKAALVLAALESASDPIPPADTGSVRDDLVAMTASIAVKSRAPGYASLLAEVMAEARRNPELAQVHEAFVVARRAPVVAALRRGIRRGELPADLDVEATLDCVFGPMLWRLLTETRPIASDFPARVIDCVLTDPPRRRPRGNRR
jgi:AcrR family transcriptional regulator